MSNSSSIDHIFSDAEEEIYAAQATATVASMFIENLPSPTAHRGRSVGTYNVKRGPCSWYQDYLEPNPVYPSHHFRNVFRIPLSLYRTLEDQLLEEEPLLEQQCDGLGRPGHTPWQTILCTLRRLTSGVSFKQLDDMARMSVESQRSAFRLTLCAIYRRFGRRYLNREPTLAALRNIEMEYRSRGFPGCIGAVDCMHLKWKNCPKQYKGQYHNPKEGKLATLSCEAVCDSRLYCWHWLAGRCGTNNDITVVDNSPLFIDILNGKRCLTLPEGYPINGVTRHWLLYFLGDGIYPKWAVLVLPIHSAVNDREKNLTTNQESTRKDIERFFGVLQGRFRILRGEMFEWRDEMLILMSQVCVILHNMIVEMDRQGELDEEVDENGVAINVVAEVEDNPSGSEESGFIPINSVAEEDGVGLVYLLNRNDAVTSQASHYNLQSALAQHQWNIRGNE